MANIPKLQVSSIANVLVPLFDFSSEILNWKIHILNTLPVTAASHLSMLIFAQLFLINVVTLL